MTTSIFKNRFLLLLILCIIISSISRGQSKTAFKKDFYRVKIVPTNYLDSAGEYFTKDASYTKIMRLDTLAIPYLIEKLSDTTLTTISYHCDNTKLRRGDIALFLINDIETIPVNDVMQAQYGSLGSCSIFPDGFFKTFRDNRTRFQEQYKKYYYSEERQAHIRQVH